jgi:diguanylate cyclase (GGDEF)-like protein
MAVVASNYIQRLGFNIPEDCIVTGFDGTMQADYHLPHLTTCRQNYDEMGRRITDTIIRLRNGENCSGGIVDFHIRYSQSCGCEKIAKRNINDSMRAVLDRYKQAASRQMLMCDIQSSVSGISDITELPHTLMDKFQFSTCVFALNDDAIEPPGFGRKNDGEPQFTENVRILCQRYHWVEQEPCTIKLADLLPDYISITKRPEPIIVCCLHFIGWVFGYCAFQPRIEFDEYEKMHTLMNALDSSFGTFHSKMRIEYVNEQLIAANEELRRSSLHDFMTGLFNRRGFYSETQKLIGSGKYGDEAQIALIFADLDGLKHINDSFGHSEGDNAIITLAHALLSSTFRGEICARFGGDEFCVSVLVPRADAESYCERFKRNFTNYLSNFNNSSGKPYKVEASIGFYLHDASPDLDLEELANTADKLMYEEKIAHRKNRIEQ